MGGEGVFDGFSTPGGDGGEEMRERRGKYIISISAFSWGTSTSFFLKEGKVGRKGREWRKAERERTNGEGRNHEGGGEGRKEGSAKQERKN